MKRTALERLWEEYHFGPLVEEAYPCDACGLQGLSMFLEFHIGRNGEFPRIRLERFPWILKDLGGALVCFLKASAIPFQKPYNKALPESSTGFW